MKSLFYLLALYLNFVCAGRDYYSILGITRSAGTKDIKKAYRRMAKEMHPDKNPNDPDANSRFQDLGAAYEALVDPEKRKLYDKCGEECLQKEGQMGGGGDPFSSFFGGFGFDFGDGGQNGEREHQKGKDVVMDLWVTLDELYIGNFIELTRNKPVIKPAWGNRKCNCRQEMVTRSLGPGRYQMMQQEVCDDCPNVKLVNEERILEVEIETGMSDGMETRFTAEGEPHMDGGEPGDLVLKVRTYPHPVFERKIDDLFVNMTVSLTQALIGFKAHLVHLDGHTVEVSREQITWPGARIRKKDEGMPNYHNNNRKGALFITLDIDFPKGVLTLEEKELVTKLLKTRDSERPIKFFNGLGGFK